MKSKYLAVEKAKTPFLFIISPQTIRVFTRSTKLRALAVRDEARSFDHRFLIIPS